MSKQPDKINNSRKKSTTYQRTQSNTDDKRRVNKRTKNQPNKPYQVLRQGLPAQWPSELKAERSDRHVTTQEWPATGIAGQNKGLHMIEHQVNLRGDLKQKKDPAHEAHFVLKVSLLCFCRPWAGQRHAQGAVSLHGRGHYLVLRGLYFNNRHPG